ncbi:hypothetical protein LIER_41763 [Lithospermum erythrorhizon]|uniref:Uncharacterized protein n=1 Tax=Lithospermum erythrorhizon TaxID=34254 RepID=A0AAV3RG31_LITER
MANSKIFITLFFLVLILPNVVFGFEGRRLAIKRRSLNIHIDAKVTYASTEGGSPSELIEKPEGNATKGHLDSFRPTKPGHSPGIGHSKHD